MLNCKADIVEAGKELRSRIKEGKDAVDAFYDKTYEHARKGDIDFRRVSLKTLFEEFVEDGREAVSHMEPNYHASGRTWVQEAGDAVDTSHFSNIFGQLTYANFMDKYESPELIGRSLFTTVPAATQYQEIVPGVSKLGDLGQSVGEGETYPEVGLSENYVTMPRKIKTGFQISVTEETIWEDKNGLIVDALGSAAEIMAINEEKELLDVALGLSTLYSRNGGAAQATYGDTHTNGTFDNLSASTGLVDYTDIEAALLLFDAITDPETGEPIMLGGPLQMVVPTALKFTARNILNATGIQIGSTTSATVPVLTAASPLSGDGQAYELKSNQYVKARTTSASTWFIGNFRKAFRYHEIWPIQVIQMPADSYQRYSRDIITGVRVRRKGRAGVYDPRYVVKCTA